MRPFIVLLTVLLSLGNEFIVPTQQLPTEHVHSCNAIDTNVTFVLVHGLGFGAWAWYKVVTHLKSRCYAAVALDLTAAGINLVDPNQVATLHQWAQPLLDVVSNFSGPGKIVLVGHSLGGLFISMAMDAFNDKILAGIFVAAVMPLNGDDFAATAPPNFPIVTNDSVLVYGDPTSDIPTSGYVRKERIPAIFLNRSPKQDVELTLLLTRPSPFRPLLEKVQLGDGYRKVRRFYIRTLHDNAVPLVWQDFDRDRNPGATTFNISSDHAVFFSRPLQLTNLFTKVVSDILP